MNSFVKTCVADVLLLVALAVPVFGAGGCERQSEPPVTPRSDAEAPPPAGRSAQPNTHAQDPEKAATEQPQQH